MIIMDKLWFIAPLYITYYTFTYAKLVWNKGNKWAGFLITLMAVAIIVLPVWIFRG